MKNKIVYDQYLEEDSDGDSDDNCIREKKLKTKKRKKFVVESENAESDGNMKVLEEEDEENSESNKLTSECLSEESESDGDKPKKTEFPAASVLGSIKNKIRRNTQYQKWRQEQKKAKKEKRRLLKKEEESTGKVRKKKVPKTIESKREDDSAQFEEDHDEMMKEEMMDEYANYYAKTYDPKVLITASTSIHGHTIKFIKELALVIPNATALWRMKLDIRKKIEGASKKGFTDVIIINEDKRNPTGITLVHLPDGPTAYFRLSNVQSCKQLRKKKRNITTHRPELILTNFKTRLGRQVARMLGALFHTEPEFSGRSVCTFHNQRDYIFFRHHRYQFKNKEKAKLLELGPRFTMRLQWLQKGVLEGDFDWVLKRHEMESSRTKFNL